MPEPRHLDPWQPKTGKSPRVAKRPSLARWSITATVLGIALATGLTLLHPLTAGDNVSRHEVDQRKNEFAKSPGLKLVELPVLAASSAIGQLPLEANQKAALLKAVAHPTPAEEPLRPAALKVAQITVWDTHQQDGDIVAINSGAFRIELPLTKAPLTVAVPVEGAAPLRIVGVRDGGGGITLGIRSGDSAMLMPIMSEGQELVLPLR